MKTKTGSALLLTTILLFVVLSLVVSLSYVTVMEQQMSSKTKSSVGSFFNADSGVEWALNQIANSSATTIAGAFPTQWNAANHYAACPMGGCNVYFLDETGKVITLGTDTIDKVKAVRSVGTQTTGDPTQRAIEAAVASGGGGCYISYASPPGTKDSTGKCLQGFTNKGSAGTWGMCYAIDSYGEHFTDYPPGGGCTGWNSYSSGPAGEAFVCCL